MAIFVFLDHIESGSVSVIWSTLFRGWEKMKNSPACSGAKNWLCSDCGRHFYSQSSLIDHKKRKHLGTPLYSSVISLKCFFPFFSLLAPFSLVGFFFILCMLFNTASSAAPQIPLGSNPGQLRQRHWLSGALRHWLSDVGIGCQIFTCMQGNSFYVPAINWTITVGVAYMLHDGARVWL